MIKSPATDDNSLAPALNYFRNKIRVKFDGNCLKQSNITYAHGTIVNIYIVQLLISCLEYSFIINKHNQMLTSTMENQR